MVKNKKKQVVEVSSSEDDAPNNGPLSRMSNGKMFNDVNANNNNAQSDDEGKIEMPIKKKVEKKKNVSHNTNKKHKDSSSEDDESSSSSSSDDEEEQRRKDEEAKKSRKQRKEDKRRREEEKKAEEERQRTPEYAVNRKLVTFTYSGTPAQFGSDPKKTISSLSANAEKIFGKPRTGTDISSNGKKYNHIWESMTIKRVKNTFGFDIMVSSPNFGENNVFSAVPNSPNGIYHVFANEDSTPDRVIAKKGETSSSSDEMHPFLADYPGFNTSNLKEGITKVPNTKFSLVSVKNPVCGMFCDGIDDESAREQFLGEAQNGYVQIEQKDVETCLAHIQDLLTTDIGMTDLSELSFKIARSDVSLDSNDASKSWTSQGNINSKDLDDITALTGTLSIEVEILSRDA